MIVIDPKTKKEYLISLSKSHGEETMTCPSCSESRKKKNDKCFSYNHEKQVGHCNHCGIALVEKKEVQFKKEYQRPPKWENKTNLSDKLVKYYSEKRGLHQETLKYFQVGEGVEFMPQLGKEVNTIQFPYIRNGEVVNIKYKTANKKFKMFKDAELIFFNIDSIKDKKICLITEGEEDCMAVRQATVEEVISVPNGATTGKINMEYVDNCIEYFLDPEMKIYLGTDDDLPGRNLQEQLAERFGKERCFKVKWKESKDANECLMKFGAGGILESINEAKPYPLEGITTIADYEDEVNDIYVNGLPKGAKTKMSNINELIQFHKGYFTVITGVPNQGKTSFLDQLVLQLSLVNGWKGAFYSPENKPTSLHISNLCRKLIGKAWWGDNRINPQEVAIAKQFLNERFYFVSPEKGFGLDSILRHIKRLKETKGIDFFVIDAWNKLEHKHGGDENSYIGQSLDIIDSFCNYNKLHLFLVAHPRKMSKKKDSQVYEVPTAYDINGCHDEMTEVLTNVGWKRHADLDGSEFVACYDLSEESITYQRPSKYHKYKYEGEMFKFGGYGMDIFVTPNHRMIVKPNWSKKPDNGTNIGRACKYEHNKWQFVTAMNVSKSPMKIPRAAELKSDSCLPKKINLDAGYITDDLLTFMGWYISEGYYSSCSIGVCQAEKDCQEIRDLYKRMGLDYTDSIQKSKRGQLPMWYGRIKKRSHPQLCNWILENCGKGFKNKKIPDIVFSASKHQKLMLMESLIKGDGSKLSNGLRYHTASEVLANQIQKLGIELGFKSNLSSTKGAKPHHSTKYTVDFNFRTESWLMPANLKKSYYNGIVYCLTVPTGAYITRRNGKMAITGNSANFFNKPDINITVYRDYEENETRVYIQKVKFDHWGKQGYCRFKYDPESGRFNEYYGGVENFDRYPWIFEAGAEPPKIVDSNEAPF